MFDIKENRTTFRNITKEYSPNKPTYPNWEKQPSLGIFDCDHFLPTKDKSITIDVGHGISFEILKDLEKSSLVSEIKKSKFILDLEDNWDARGAIKYKPETYKNAILFLINNAEKSWNIFGDCIDAPKIFPGPNGSIYVLWKKPTYNYLITIPEFPNLKASYYGVDKPNKEYPMEGYFNITKEDRGVLLSIIKTV